MCVCVCVCLCVCYIIILDMFRAVLCSSSGGRIITASGIVTLCKQLYSTPVESRLLVCSQPAYCTAIYRE